MVHVTHTSLTNSDTKFGDDWLIWILKEKSFMVCVHLKVDWKLKQTLPLVAVAISRLLSRRVSAGKKKWNEFDWRTNETRTMIGTVNDNLTSEDEKKSNSPLAVGFLVKMFMATGVCHCELLNSQSQQLFRF